MTIEDWVAMILEHSETVDDAAAEYDLEAIAAEIKEKTGATHAELQGLDYDLADADVELQTDEFWKIVEAHAKPR